MLLLLPTPIALPSNTLALPKITCGSHTFNFSPLAPTDSSSSHPHLSNDTSLQKFKRFKQLHNHWLRLRDMKSYFFLTTYILHISIAITFDDCHFSQLKIVFTLYSHLNIDISLQRRCYLHCIHWMLLYLFFDHSATALITFLLSLLDGSLEIPYVSQVFQDIQNDVFFVFLWWWIQ